MTRALWPLLATLIACSACHSGAPVAPSASRPPSVGSAPSSPRPTAVVLSKAQAAGGLSHLETDVKFFGGVTLGDVLSKNLLGGTKNTSIVSGGLISKGRTTSLVGAAESAP